VNIMRLLRHLFSTRASGRKAFPAHSLQAILKTIKHGESLHRAELRLMIEPALEFSDLLSGMQSRQRAHELFAQYRVWDTEENSGILLYLNLADHQLEIIADRGVGPLLTSLEWQHVSRIMTSGFAAGRFEESAVQAIEELNAMLHKVLPAREGVDNPNELPDRPLML
jgi:uncharacterized membrane protein